MLNDSLFVHTVIEHQEIEEIPHKGSLSEQIPKLMFSTLVGQTSKSINYSLLRFPKSPL